MGFMAIPSSRLVFREQIENAERPAQQPAHAGTTLKLDKTHARGRSSPGPAAPARAGGRARQVDVAEKSSTVARVRPTFTLPTLWWIARAACTPTRAALPRAAPPGGVGSSGGRGNSRGRPAPPSPGWNATHNKSNAWGNPGTRHGMDGGRFRGGWAGPGPSARDTLGRMF